MWPIAIAPSSDVRRTPKVDLLLLLLSLRLLTGNIFRSEKQVVSLVVSESGHVGSDVNRR